MMQTIVTAYIASLERSIILRGNWKSRYVVPQVFDTTKELDGRQYIKVTDGAQKGRLSSVGKVFASEGFSNQAPSRDASDDSTPLAVTPVLSRAGYLRASAITTKNLPAIMKEGKIVATKVSNIGYFAEYFDGVVLQRNRLVVVQNALGEDSPNEDSATHFGLYRVTSEGDSTSPWELERYKHGDDDGDGNPEDFVTGVVAIEQGSLRTPITGQMYEIGYDSINRAEINYREIKDFRDVTEVVVAQGITEIEQDTSSFIISNEIAEKLRQGLTVVGAGFAEDTKISGFEEVSNGYKIHLSKEITATNNAADVLFIEQGTYLTLDFDAMNNYRTDIGTRNVIGKVTYQVSSEAGDNESPSSLGRILNLLQSNTATVERVR